jgi:hypothetical protein
MNALSMLMLRFKQPGPRPFRVPLNFRFGKTEIPVGLGIITVALILLATVNVFTKKVATISGLCFTAGFYIMFEAAARINRKRISTSGADNHKNELFRLAESEDIGVESLGVRPGNVLVAVRNPNQLDHLQRVLQKTDTRRMDIVVVTVRLVEPTGEELATDQVFGDAEAKIFSRVVEVAEKAGKHVELVTVQGADPWEAVVQTAARLKTSRIVTGLSPKFTAQEQGKIVGAAWEKLAEPRPALSLEVALSNSQSLFFNLGPHPPRLWPEDVDLVHRLWLELSERYGAKLRHRDVVGVALRRLARDMRDEHGDDALLRDFDAEIHSHEPEAPNVASSRPA